jgi:DNA-binding transcriptional regulator YiaG
MTSHAHSARVLGGEARERELPIYDATTFVGLRTIVHNAAIERTEQDGEVTIELPKLDELAASAAIMRCLMSQRLRGREIRVMRRLMKLTLADLAQKMDGKTAPETISRWETETQPMGGYAEKVFRLLVCETLKESAPGVEYNGKMIAELTMVDPWRTAPEYEVPALTLELIKLKQGSSITQAWNKAA